ncbi:hypothetical protein D3C71_1152790 [compost metagenome]
MRRGRALLPGRAWRGGLRGPGLCHRVHHPAQVPVELRHLLRRTAGLRRGRAGVAEVPVLQQRPGPPDPARHRHRPWRQRRGQHLRLRPAQHRQGDQRPGAVGLGQHHRQRQPGRAELGLEQRHQRQWRADQAGRRGTGPGRGQYLHRRYPHRAGHHRPAQRCLAHLQRDRGAQCGRPERVRAAVPGRQRPGQGQRGQWWQRDPAGCQHHRHHRRQLHPAVRCTADDRAGRQPAERDRHRRTGRQRARGQHPCRLRARGRSHPGRAAGRADQRPVRRGHPQPHPGHAVADVAAAEHHRGHAHHRSDQHHHRQPQCRSGRHRAGRGIAR